MSRYQPDSLDCKVYVGGLTRTANREEIERAFGHYGKLKNVFVARNPPGFAFVEFDEPQDAEDSVRALDGRLVCGVRVRVEISHGKSRTKGPGGRRSNDRDMGGRDRPYRRSNDRSRERNGGRERSMEMNGARVRRRSSRSSSRSKSDRNVMRRERNPIERNSRPVNNDRSRSRSRSRS